MNKIFKRLTSVSLIFFALNYYVFGIEIAIWGFFEMVTLLIILEKIFNDRF